MRRLPKLEKKSSNVTPPSSSVAQQTTSQGAKQLPLPCNENLYIFDMQQAWKHFREFLPNEVFHLDVPSDKQGVYGSGVYLHVPSKAMMKKPDLQELFNFMAKDSINHVLLSRLLIDYEHRLCFRQFGRMKVSISEPEKKIALITRLTCYGSRVDMPENLLRPAARRVTVIMIGMMGA